MSKYFSLESDLFYKQLIFNQVDFISVSVL